MKVHSRPIFLVFSATLDFVSVAIDGSLTMWLHTTIYLDVGLESL